jgi:acyl-CoA synthetase (AMP-forming)/AMP-acid ligase II
VNIILLLETIASMYPERLGVADSRGAVTYAELHNRALRWGSWLRREGGGRSLLYVGQSNITFVELLLGAAATGTPVVPINFRVKLHEFSHFVETSQPSIVLTEERYQSDLVEALNRSKCDAKIIEAHVALPAADTFEAPFKPDLPAVQLFTSGSTGLPKLVSLTHQNLASYVFGTVNAGSAEETTSLLLCTPPYHIAAVANILTNLFRGRRLVLMERFDPFTWLETVRLERVTHAMVVPTMLVRILDAVESRPELMPESLMGLSYGGSAAPEGLIERALKLLPEHVGLVNAYGLTETSSTIALLGPEDHRLAWRHADPRVRERLRSVGRPLPGIEIKVMDEGHDVPAGEVGELYVRGAQVALGGRRSTGAEDGWLATGDGGYVDDAGYVFVLGRRDDVIIRGGENIAPGEVEGVLRRHPAVDDAAVVGVPESEWGQTIAAVVTLSQEIDEAHLKDWVGSILAGYKVPTKIRRVDKIPRNDLGKVIRPRVLELLEL